MPLKYSSNVRLIDDGCLSHPVNKGRLALPLSTPRAIDGVMYSVLYLQVVLKLLHTSDLPRSKPVVRIALLASASARYNFTSTCCYNGTQ